MLILLAVTDAKAAEYFSLLHVMGHQPHWTAGSASAVHVPEESLLAVLPKG